MGRQIKTRIYLFWLFVCLFCGLPADAAPISSLFDNYSVGDGLTDKTIHCIFQDSKGWIWIGTDFGVSRFDGYRFRKFTFDSETGHVLSNALIRTIVEDQSGIIWIGTEAKGLFKYDRKYYRIEQIKNEALSNNSVWSIVEEDHKLWLGTEYGITCYDPVSGRTEMKISSNTHPDLLSGNVIRKMAIDKYKRLWVGTEKGVTVLNSDLSLWKAFPALTEDITERENEVWEIFCDSDGNMLVGTYLGGLYKFSGDFLKPEKVIFDPYNNRAETVRSVAQDKKGNIWIGTRGGLYTIDKTTNKVTHYEENIIDEFSLVHNSVLNLRFDAKGDLWIGTRNGISYLNFERQAFAYINSYNCGETNLNNSEVYALWEDNDHNLWIGTESGGINILDRSRASIKYLTTKQGLSNNCVKAICPDTKGNILIGTYLGGFNRYNPRTGENKIFLHDEKDINSLGDNSIWVIYTDSKSRIWVGTYSGVDLFNEEDETFTHYGEKYGVDGVSSIYEDTRERLWMYSSDLKRLTMITPEGEIRNFPIQTWAITNDPEGNLWIGTLGQGLIKFDPGKGIVEQYTTQDGLCSDVIYGMEKVNGDQLWLSTNNGLSRFFFDRKKFFNYYESDGLLNNQFNYHASLKCSGNTLAFGGKKGVDFVFLSELLENEYIPPVVLTDFRIFNKSVAVRKRSDNGVFLNNMISETREITLPYDQNMITFEFAALNFANSEKNSYKYMLEGFDKNWNDIGTNHSATYTNLDFGEYIFRVIGTNSNNKYDPEGLSFKLNILPPFWKTWLFRFLIFGLISILFYFIYLFIVNREKLKHQLYFERENARQLQELDRLKHKFFMNISHEIRTPLSLIMGPLEKILSTDLSKESILAHINIMKRNTSILRKLVDQLLDYRRLETGNLNLNLKQGNLSIFLQEMITPFKQLANDRNIELDFNISDKSLFLAFDSDKVEKILNNLISNAIKYTESGGKINISVSPTLIDELEYTDNYIPPVNTEKGKIQKFVKIVVRDTGIGIPDAQVPRIFDRFRQIENDSRKSSSGAGIGLSLTKELVKLHNGHIKVKSILGKGTKFTVLLPYIDQDNAGSRGRMEPSADMRKKREIPQNLDTNEHEKQKSNHIILVVDDNPDIREFIRIHFEPEYRVITAEDGKEAWTKSLDLVPDLIISDIMMPGIDGVELCRKIKDDERTSHIPVIMLTALTSKEKRLAAISSGADDYIDKPFDVALLKAKADNILYIRKSLRERFSKELLLKPKDVVIASPEEKFLRKVIHVIEKNMAHPDLDVDYLARQVGVSRTQLYRKISALTDMAVKEFVKDIRLKRASQLIIQGKLNISEIALEVGFNDISYFRKCFKEKYGVSASKYMKTVPHDSAH